MRHLRNSVTLQLASTLIGALVILTPALVFAQTDASQDQTRNAEKKQQDDKTKEESTLQELRRRLIDGAKTKKIEAKELKVDSSNESVSKQFLRMFDASKKGAASKRPEPVFIRRSGVVFTKPDGWVELPSNDERLIVVLEQAGAPGNRIELRRSGNLAASKKRFFLDSFRVNVENSGFRPAILKDETPSDSEDRLLEASGKKVIGGLRGDFVSYDVDPSSAPAALKRDAAQTKLQLFLYQGEKNDAWIFAAYSVIGEIVPVQKAFEAFIQSAQFDVD